MGETLLVRYLRGGPGAGRGRANRENERRQTEGGLSGGLPGGEPRRKQVRLHQGREGGRRMVAGGAAVPAAAGDGRRRLRPGRSPGVSRLRNGRPAGPLPALDRGRAAAVAEQVEFTPTPKQMLYGHAGRAGPASWCRREGDRAVDGLGRGRVEGLARAAADRSGSSSAPSTSRWRTGKPTRSTRARTTGTATGARRSSTGCVAGGRTPSTTGWPARNGRSPPATGRARRARRAFLAGLDAFHAAGPCTTSSRASGSSSAATAATPVLLVQGPPGTGKSYSTAFAVFARLQGAMEARRDFRVFVSCKTHAATDVLLKNVLEVREKLRELRGRTTRALFATHFDARLLDVPALPGRPRTTRRPPA